MHHEHPSPAQLRNLITTALNVRDLAPWCQLAPRQPYGVRDPISGRVVLAVVSGGDGTQPGISAFPGISGHLTMLRLIHDALPEVDQESLIGIRALICCYAARSALGTSERRLLEDAGFRFRRGELAPRFRSYMPGYTPWTLSADEARVLTLVLEHTLEFAMEAGLDSSFFEGAPKYSYRIRQLVSRDGYDDWIYAWAKADLEGDSPVRLRRLDELTSARLARLPCDDAAEWEISAESGLGSLDAGPDERPELLQMLFVVDRASGYIHLGEPVAAPNVLEEAQPMVSGLLLRLGYRPRRMLVRELALRAHLASLARAAGCRLQRVRRLPAVEAANRDMVRAMSRRG